MAEVTDPNTYFKPYGVPVATIAELEELDTEEMIEGYSDGFHGEPEPQGNRSKSYSHGWRNGAVDGGYRDCDDAQRKLAKELLSLWRTSTP